MTTYLTIFRRLPTTFRRFPKIFQNCSEGKANVSEHFSEIFRRLPKISEDFRGGTDGTIAMVIILVTMVTITTVISSRVKINLLLTEREGRTGEYWPKLLSVFPAFVH